MPRNAEAGHLSTRHKYLSSLCFTESRGFVPRVRHGPADSQRDSQWTGNSLSRAKMIKNRLIPRSIHGNLCQRKRSFNGRRGVRNPEIKNLATTGNRSFCPARVIFFRWGFLERNERNDRAYEQLYKIHHENTTCFSRNLLNVLP